MRSANQSRVLLLGSQFLDPRNLSHHYALRLVEYGYGDLVTPSPEALFNPIGYTSINKQSPFPITMQFLLQCSSFCHRRTKD